jgi:stage III sporulation protein AA
MKMLEGYLPNKILDKINKFENIQEIRFRLGKQLGIISGGKEYLFDTLSKNDFGQVVTMLTSHSIYALSEYMKNGFITLPEGHRVGFCGSCVLKNNEIYHFKNINGINIRIANEFLNVSESLCKDIFKNGPENLLIISPPGCGKTTYLRDISRIISNNGYNVSVVDERNEIFPYNSNGSIFKNGMRTDVISGCNKAEGIKIMLKVMNPDVIICDEITSSDDADMLFDAASSGVKVIASMHGFNVDDYSQKTAFKKICENNIFKKFIILGKSNGVGTVEKVI